MHVRIYIYIYICVYVALRAWCLFHFMQKDCNVNACNFSNSFTPLHLAAQRGYSRIIESLVGYGADVNATAGDGQTALHLVLTLKSMRQASQDTPEFEKVQPSTVHLHTISIKKVRVHTRI